MKRFFIFLIAFFPYELYAQESDNQGIITDIAEDYLEDVKIKFSNNLVLDANFDDNYQATVPTQEFKNSSVNARLYSSLNFTENFFLKSYLELRPQGRNLPDGGDHTFENEGINVRELAFGYDNKKIAIIAGKFNLNYGTAWKWNRGIWIRDIAQNYRQQEKIGFSGIYHAGNSKKVGEYNFGLSIFKNDRKYLDNAIFNKRDSAAKGELAGDALSFQTSLDVNFNFSEKEKLSYHFSYLNMGVNSRATLVDKNKIENQKGFVAGMNYKLPLSNNFLLDSLLEYNHTKNLNGNSDVTENYFVGNVIARIYDAWNLTLGYGQRQNIQVVQYGFDENLSEISMGYEFKKNKIFDKLLLQIGYKNQRINYKTSLETYNSVGLLVRYIKDF